VLVTGFVAVLLAQFLSRPIRTLRRATTRLADGDLAVRVSPELERADAETRALGEDMDRMAARIHELLDGQRRLLRDVSHELRTPLARLGIALELVRRKAAPELEPALDRIARESDRLAAMIGELLTLSRLESRAELERVEPVDLGGLLGEIAGDVGFEAESRGARIELGRVDEAVVDGNEELLRRAVENVLRNAVRFTREGTSVEVCLEAREGEARLVVRDHGPGVPDDALPKLFEPFFRVGDDRARGEGGGAGIGLAITHGAITLHGGAVRAQNAEGGGLLVELRLPLASGAAGGAPSTASAQ
jgi:signal transduction histidine kinase